MLRHEQCLSCFLQVRCEIMLIWWKEVNTIRPSKRATKMNEEQWMTGSAVAVTPMLMTSRNNWLTCFNYVENKLWISLNSLHNHVIWIQVLQILIGLLRRALVKLFITVTLSLEYLHYVVTFTLKYVFIRSLVCI